MADQDLNQGAMARSYSCASSLGVLAVDELDREIRLTRFGSLDQESCSASGELQHVINMARCSPESDTTIQQLVDEAPPRPCIGRLYGCMAISGAGKQRQFDLEQQAQQVELWNGADLIPKQQQRDSPEFQVVWRALSFDVATSTYDRLVNLTLDGLNSAMCLGRSSAASENKWSRKAERLDCSEQQLAGQVRGAEKRVDRRNVFENLSGHVRSGEISAILGPSGAGKTSLLSALCGADNLDNYRGSIEVHGGALGPKQHMQLSIIPQKDFLIENLSVRENLQYSSRLLNPASNFDHEANIARVVDMLSLARCLDSTASNISGGEYKRASIAQELLRQPDILILDEPTSGLDSLNCKKLIRTLKSLIEASRAGRMKPLAVVMTIHQPDVEVFNMFNHVYCMARRGRVIFDGPPSEVLDTLRQHAGFTPSNSPAELLETAQVNPANLLIEIASEDLYGQQPIDRLASLQRKQFEQAFGRASPALSGACSPVPSSHNLQRNLFGRHLNAPFAADQCSTKSSLVASVTGSDTSLSSSLASVDQQQQNRLRAQQQVANECATGNKLAPRSLKRDKRLGTKRDHTGRFWYHTRLLTKRAFVSALRDPLLTFVSLIFHLFVPFVMWTVYPRRVGTTSACPVIQRQLDIVTMTSNKTMSLLEGIQADLMIAFECSTMLFITCYALSICTLTIAALAFPLNMHILLKEVRNGWYDLKAFVLAKQLACFPFEVLFPATTMVLIYVMLDMPPSDYNWRLWSLAGVTAAIAMISNTHGLIIGTLCMDSVQSAVFTAIASTLPQIMLSGFTVRIKWLPELFQHLSWLSLYRYSSELINVIRFGFGICPCSPATDEYLRSQRPTLTDLPANLKPMFLYYLSESTPGELDATTTLGPGAEMNATTPTTTELLASNHSSALAAQVPGVSADLALTPLERRELLARMEAGEVDIFGQMAEMMSRSLAYGRQIVDCSSVKSQLLLTVESEAEENYHYMIGGLLLVLVSFKLLLFLVVRFKVGSRT